MTGGKGWLMRTCLITYIPLPPTEDLDLFFYELICPEGHTGTSNQSLIFSLNRMILLLAIIYVRLKELSDWRCWSYKNFPSLFFHRILFVQGGRRGDKGMYEARLSLDHLLLHSIVGLNRRLRIIAREGVSSSIFFCVGVQ